ncbi:nucleolar protein dao-5-like [Cydia fagiglandana]|uniref:nucleolar protein dao-5-like n=1 Tax=Cydia fagiglandana TaxID=1458189 RepID=UPI002FEE2A16
MGSSDEEFGWTHTSNDDSDTEPEKTYDGESESGKNFKKKLQKELFQNGDHNESHERKKLKNPKREESSLSPSPRRVKRESLANGHDDSAAAKHMLKMKIKEEKASFAVPHGSPRKRRASAADTEPEQPRKKKKKRDREREEQESSAIETVDGSAADPDDAASEEPAERCAKTSDSESPKKKKNRKKTVKDSSNDQEYFDGWSKFEAEETVVQERPTPKKREEEVKPFTSKEFVSDDDSSEDERPAPAPALPSARSRASLSDAKSVESPRRARMSMSDRITFEEESQAETGSKTRKESHASTESPRRPRLSERITFEEDSHSGPEPPAPVQNITQRRPPPVERRRISEQITFEEDSHSGPEPPAPVQNITQRRPPPVERRRISEQITFEEDSHSGPEPPAPVQNITQRKPPPIERRRISERITFEDSTSEPERAPPPAPARGSADGGRLGRFLRAHAHMHPVLGDFPPGAALTADDDVWIVRCPRDLPVGALKGITLDVDFKSKLKIGGRAYEATPAAAEGDSRVAVLAPAARGRGFCVRAVRLRGQLRLRARPPRPRAPLPQDEGEPERVPLPDTRPRHPLLGADFDRPLPAEVKRRLAAAGARAERLVDEVDSDARREKKKKKKKRRERPEPEPEVEPEVEPEPERKKRKPKRGSSAGHEREPRGSERDLESPPRKKKVKKEKKEKKRRDDAAVWDSERAIEESLFNF